MTEIQQTGKAEELLKLLLRQAKEHALILLDPQGIVVGCLLRTLRLEWVMPDLKPVDLTPHVCAGFHQLLA